MQEMLWNVANRTGLRVQGARGPVERVALADRAAVEHVRLRRGLPLRERQPPGRERQHRMRTLRSDLLLHFQERRQLERIAAFRRVRLNALSDQIIQLHSHCMYCTLSYCKQFVLNVNEHRQRMNEHREH